MTFEQCDRKLARLVSRYAAGQLTDEAYLRGIHKLGPVWSRLEETAGSHRRQEGAA